MAKKPLTFGKLKKKEPAKKAAKDYPVLDDPDLYDVVDELVLSDKKIKALEGTLSSAKETLREAALPLLVKTIQTSDTKSVVVKGTNDNTEVMVMITDGFRSNANEDTVGPEYWDRFSQFASISIDADKLGDKAEEFIAKLSELAEELDVVNAVSVKETYKPSSMKELIEDLSKDEALDLDSRYKFPTMIKVR